MFFCVCITTLPLLYPMRAHFPWGSMHLRPFLTSGAWIRIGLQAQSLASCQREFRAGLRLPRARAPKGQARAPPDAALSPEDRVLTPPPTQSLQGRGHPQAELSWVSHLSLSSAECSVTGDIHFTTFDGRRYTFPATCQYILAKSRSSGTFTVTLQNAPCGLVRAGEAKLNPPASVPCPLPRERLGDLRLRSFH